MFSRDQSDQDKQGFNLSLAQKDIYFDKLHIGESVLYNIGISCELLNVNIDVIAQAHQQLVVAEKFIHCRLNQIGETLVLAPSNHAATRLKIIDHSDNAKPQTSAQRFIEQQITQPFNIEDEDLYRCFLIKLSPEKSLYVLCAHHLILDDMSLVNWMRRLSDIYHSLINNTQLEQLPALTDWPSVLKQEAEYIKSNQYKEDQQYWQSRLQTPPQPLFKAHYQHLFEQVDKAPSQRLQLSTTPEQFELIQKVASDLNTNAATLSIAIICHYLSQIYQRSKLVLGCANPNRYGSVQQQMLGTFTNINPLAIEVGSSQTIAELCAIISKTQQTTHAHNRYPQGHILRDLDTNGHRHRLFDVQFNYFSLVTERQIEGQNLILQRHPNNSETTPLVLTLLEISEQQPLEIEMDINLAYFTPQEGQLILNRLMYLLKQVIDKPQTPLSKLKLIPPQERAQLAHFQLSQINSKQPANTVIHQFETICQQHPQKVALKFAQNNIANQEISYQQLNQQANQVAHLLINQGIMPGDRVGLSLLRSPKAVIAILAIFKVGACYIPLDPNYPKSRIEHIIDDSQLKLVITDNQSNSQQPINTPTLLLNDLTNTNELPPELGDIDLNLAQPEASSYIIYTSGSTGAPKGVEVSHGALHQHITSISQHYQINQNDVITLFASFNFDPSLEQLFNAICHGATSLLIDHQTTHSEQLLDFLAMQQVTVADIPPSYFLQLMKSHHYINTIKSSQLRMMIFGGEALDASIVDAWRKHRLFAHCELINAYGPTEATITATVNKLNESSHMPPTIGRFPPKRGGFVLNKQFQQCPIGIEGELYLTEPMLAKGYFNLPQLSAEKFITLSLPSKHDFTPQPQRLYRTGDKVRWLADGELAFIGRFDNQVKIRGFRVELQEIGYKLKQLPQVQNSCVLLHPQKKPLQIAAVVELNDQFKAQTTKQAITDIKTELLTHLPNHMVPTTIELIEQWPLTPTGKVDIKALSQFILQQESQANPQQTSKTFTLTATEQTLLDLWSEALEISTEEICIQDNFFVLGGHSLMALQILRDIEAQLGLKLEVVTLFAQPSISALAAHIDSQLAAPPQAEYQEFQIGKRRYLQNQDLLPLSYGQQRLWLIDKIENQRGKSSAHYNISLVLTITGKLNTTKLNQALSNIIERHQPLRTIYSENEQGPVQIVQPAQSFSCDHITLTPHQSLDQTIIELCSQSFDLGQDLMLRATIIKQQQTILVINTHQIACDQQSIDVLYQELSANYNQEQSTSSLNPLSIDYQDYADWQRQQSSSVEWQQQQAYWQQQLTDAPMHHQIPLDKPRPPIKQNRGAKTSIALSIEQTHALKQLAASQQVSLFMLLHATLTLVIARHSHSDDIIIGTPVSNRRQSELAPLIGFFINAIPLRIRFDDISRQQSFSQYLQSVKAVNLAAQQHQDLPLDMIIEQSQLPRSSQYSPLFQLLFSLKKKDESQLQLQGCELKRHAIDYHMVKFDLDINAVISNTTEKQNEHHEQLTLQCDYDISLFEKTTVNRLLTHWQYLLEQVLNDCHTPITTLKLNSQNEYAELQSLQQQRLPNTNTELETTDIISIWQHSVKQRNEQLAISDQQQSLSFNALAQQVEQMIGKLQQQGLTSEHPIALCLTPSIEITICQIAIMQMGAAFVPIDPNYPSARIEYILKDSQAQAVICQQINQVKLNDMPCQVLSIEQLAKLTPSQAHPSQISAQTLAYIIYTSGTSGQPKGVMVEHGQLAHLTAALDDLGIDKNSQGWWGWCANYVFDASLQALAQLAIGRTIAIVPHEVKSQPQQLKAWLKQNPVSILDCTPSLVELWFDGGISDTLPNLVIGGEAISTELWAKLQIWQNPKRHAYNVYGPTECCVDATCAAIDQSPVNIGYPLGDSQCYIVDQFGQLTPKGLIGELWIAGPGVARGYINQSALTQESFTPNPFDRQYPVIYRTGDMVRYQKDKNDHFSGAIEYLTRKDQQIKLRGYRIEPQEIKQQIKQLCGIDSSELLIINDQLVIFLLAGRQFDSFKAKQQLMQQLPNYMVPEILLNLEQWPLTTNGKIDRNALINLYNRYRATLVSQSETNNSENTDTTPSTPPDELEQQLIDIWCEVLELDHTGISLDSDFFSLGGHSVLAIRVQNLLKQQLNIELALHQLFAHSTIAELKPVIQALIDNTESQNKQIVQTERAQQHYPLSYSQQQLWHIEQSHQQHNNVRCYQIDGQWQQQNLVHLQQRFYQVLSRHEILRSNIKINDDKAVMTIKPNIEVKIDTLDISALNPVQQQKQLKAQLSKQLNHTFDLANDALYKLLLLKLSNNQQLLIINIHPIIADTWSMEVLIKELNSSALAPLEIQYIDYVIWQQKQLRDNQERQKYWQQRLANSPQLHQLPLDKPRANQSGFNGNTLHLTLTDKQTQKLEQLANHNESTLFMLLHTAFAQLVSRNSSQNDIVIGTHAASREHSQIEPLIGSFDNLIPLRVQINKQQTFKQILAQQKQQLIKDFEQQLPFDMLIDTLNIDRNISANPIFQLVFSLNNQTATPLEIAQMNITEISDALSQDLTTKVIFDIELEAQKHHHQLSFNWHYNSDLFNAGTIKTLATNFNQLLEEICE